MPTSSHHISRCASCLRPRDQLTVPLKQCAKCHKTVYCSRGCQKAHWKAHKSTCRSDNTFQPTSMFPFPPVNGNASDRIPEDVSNIFRDVNATNQELKDAYARIEDRGAVRDLITEAGLADPGASSPPEAQAGEKVVEISIEPMAVFTNLTGAMAAYQSLVNSVDAAKRQGRVREFHKGLLSSELTFVCPKDEIIIDKDDSRLQLMIVKEKEAELD